MCDSAWLRSTSKTLYFFGRLLGAVVFGQLSDMWVKFSLFTKDNLHNARPNIGQPTCFYDLFFICFFRFVLHRFCCAWHILTIFFFRFGRRPMFFAGLLMLLIVGCVAAASPSMFVFIPFYILQGAAQTGLFLVAYTMCMYFALLWKKKPIDAYLVESPFHTVKDTLTVRN